MDEEFWQKVGAMLAVAALYILALFGIATLVALGTPEAAAGELADRYVEGVEAGVIVQPEAPIHVGDANAEVLGRALHGLIAEGKADVDQVSPTMFVARILVKEGNLHAVWDLIVVDEDRVHVFRIGFELTKQEA